MRPNKSLKVRMRQMENKTMKIRIPAVLVVIALTITTASAQYKRTDLVSNGPTVAPLLTHIWSTPGVSLHFPPAPGGLATMAPETPACCNAAGQPVIASGGTTNFVTVPPAPGSPAGTLGTPTGIVGNISPTATDFTVTEDGRSGRSAFIFATLDGTISGWNPTVGLANPATGATHAHYRG